MMDSEKQKTILLVDDEAIIAMSEKTALEKYGYNVMVTHSGEEAVTAVEATPAIDLILMDINLGSGMDGTEAAAAILKKRDIPVVFLSSHMEPEIVAKTEKITSYGYVVKDSSITVLDASIKMAFKLFQAKKQEMEKETRIESALESLKVAEETYRNIFLNAQTGLFRTEIKTGLLLDANDCVARFIGYEDREKLLEKPFNIADRYVDINDRERMISLLKEHGQFNNFEAPFKRNDGSIILMRFSAKIVPEKGWVEGVSEDITEEKAIEKVLQESKDRYKNFISQISDGVYRLELDEPMPITLPVEEQIDYLYRHMFIAECNPSFIEMYGAKEPKDVLGKTMMDFHGGSDNARNRQSMREFIASGYQTRNVVTEEIDTRGSKKYFSNNSIGIIENGFMLRMWGTQTDISVQRQTEESLQESEKRFRTLYENLPLGLYRTTPDGRIQLANPALIRMLGYSSFAELAKVDLQRSGFTASHSRARFIESIEANSKVSGLEYVWKRKDGSSVLVRENARAIRDAQGKTMYYEGIVEDISAHMQAEEELRKSEAKFRAIFDSASDGMFIVDLKTRRLLMCNAMCVKMLGYTQEEFSNLNISDIHPKEELPFIIDQIEKFSRGEEGIRNDIKFKRKNGSIFESDLGPALLTFTEEKYLLIIFKDISERKQAESQIKAALEALEVSEARSQALLRTIPDMLFRVNRQGIFLDYKADVKNLYVQSGPSIIGMRFRDILPPELADLIDLKIRSTLDSGALQTFEYGLPVPGQGNRDYEARMVASGADEVTAIIRDITERKQGEAALQKSELQLKAMMDNSPAVILLIQEGKLIYINHAAEKMTGWQEEDFIGKNFTDFVHQDDTEVVIKKNRERMGGNNFLAPYVLRINKKTGGFIYAEVNGTVIDLDGKPTMLGFLTDVSERILADEALHQSETQLSNALQMTKSGHWEYDVDRDLFTFNDNFYRIFRTTAAAAGGYQMSSADYAQRFCHPDDMALVGIETRAAIEATDPNYNRQIEHRILYADGEVGWIAVRFFIVKDAQGRTVKTYGVNQDISERKRAELALRESEERHRSILNASPDGIGITDMEGRILMVSPSVLSMVGCKREEEILGRSFTDFVSPNDRMRALSEVNRMSKNAIMGLGEYHGLRTDGSAADLEVNGEFILGADGRPAQMVFIIRDIADRKRAEEEIQRQLAEKEILLKEVHHRIKNNIASIGGLMSLRMQTVTNPEAVAVLKDAIGRIDSMRILYDKLLLSEDYKDISVKKLSREPDRYDFAIFPDQAKIMLEMRIADFHLDAKQLFPLGVIINELLTNIMKYAFIDRKTGSIKIGLSRKNNHATLAIQDNGRALPDGFDLENSKGFGLMLVKMLSQQLGGSFSMAKHKGTRCTAGI